MKRWLILAIFFVPGVGLAETGCSTSFDVFLGSFERDRQFQEAHMAFPLRHSFIDMAADPEPAPVDAPLSRKDVVAGENPLFPSPSEQAKVPLKKSVTAESRDVMVVRLQKPDSGYLLIYRFRSLDGCWQLVEFEDAST